MDKGFVSLSGLGEGSTGSFLTRAFDTSQGLSSFVNTMFIMALSIGAMLAVLQIARAGVLYMTSDAWGKKEQGKQILRDAVTGLLLLLAIWLILDQINPQLLNLDVLKKIQPIQDLSKNYTPGPDSTSAY